jgi:hypothetical protein
MTAVHTPGTAREATVKTLREIAGLFERLHAAGLPYCHWKSNEHLAASLVGATDLDVLVDRRAEQALAAVLSGLSFRRLRTAARTDYPGVESYMGLDATTGTLIHLHVHYQLTLGERYLKGYRLPWEHVLLATRVPDPASGIYVCEPHLELLLLVLRAALKVRWRDHFGGALGRTYARGNLLREFRWLADRANPGQLDTVAAPLVGTRAARLIGAMVAERSLALGRLVRFRRAVVPALERFRFSGALAARRRRWAREGAKILSRLQLGTPTAPLPTKRVFASGGLLVALIGVDGSGKSTVARELVRWLEPLLDAIPIYLGSGKGPASLPRRLLEAVAAIPRRIRGRPPVEAAPGAVRRGRGGSWLRTVGEVLWLLALARERRARLLTARRARNVGMLVICDRFLQTGIANFNDGPAFAHWLGHPNALLRWAAGRERRALDEVALQAPDLVIRLRVPAELAAQRRPTMPLEQLRHVVKTVAGLEFPAVTRVVEIDGTQPLPVVLVQAKRAVWETL